ncbi:MAG: hypothetical protein JO360_10555 [Acidobacteria bacterium]|nr:hypothetical protein [Acidobacteriota bacterium]
MNRIIVLLVMLLLVPVTAAAQARSTRIKFLPGTISTQVRGRLTRNKNADARFVVKAKAGDHMIVNIISLTEGLMTAGMVSSPSGDANGQHGGLVFNEDLTETGDYTISVERNLMGTERADGAFILEVVITPGYLKK